MCLGRAFILCHAYLPQPIQHPLRLSRLPERTRTDTEAIGVQPGSDYG